ncbi:hypothetical protein HYT17_02930 [Candidatus Microgenomates bacterium]|nr:hypothetical protein [Candidatus Microgenomates bacterium]
MLTKIIAVFIGSRALLFVFALLAIGLLPFQNISTAANSSIGFPYLQWVWGNFDGVHYVSIANSGYQYPNYAFFPFYPLLISIIKSVSLLPTLQAGLLVSYISFLLSLFFIYKIVLLDFNKTVALPAIIFLLFFPLTFYYTSVYADSLYLFLSVVSFYAARKKNWLWAGVFGFLAGLTRLIGIVLLPVLLLEWYEQHKFKIQNSKFKTIVSRFFEDKAFFLFLIPLGIIGYGLYLQINFGDFFLFQKAMAVWNQEQFVFPLQVVFRYFKILLFAPKNVVYLIALVELTATILYFVLSFYVLKKVRLSYGIFMLLTFLIPAFTGTFQGMPRYILHTFPAFIALALLTNKSKKIFWGTIVIFVILQFVFVALFTRGYFVA